MRLQVFPNAAAEIKEGSPREVQQAVSKAYSQFIDVRTPDEYATGHAARAENIPLDTLTASFDKLEKNEPVYIICETGNRSSQAASILNDAGFKNLVNVTGGTVAWKSAGLPVETGSPHTRLPILVSWIRERRQLCCRRLLMSVSLRQHIRLC
ncbi:MAG: rhodanese-like domain-containing protein [Acidobacteria bacterium]|nr:rhodanese-like domain-containing protein [Acidobacteriota bacterium]